MSSIKLFYKSPLSTWQSIFKFFNDGTSDITTNNSSLFTEQGLNFIGDNFSTSSFSSIGLLYTKHNSTTDTYVSNKIIDISNTFGNTTDPVAALDFITYLSAGIFGSPDMIDFFSNTTDIKHETVTITTNSSNTVVITLTDVQAKRLNGTLGSTSGTELPLMSNDVFHILLSIKSSVSQSTPAGNNLQTVVRPVDLTIKLS